jgi:hypothetical protein
MIEWDRDSIEEKAGEAIGAIRMMIVHSGCDRRELEVLTTVETRLDASLQAVANAMRDISSLETIVRAGVLRRNPMVDNRARMSDSAASQ